MMEHQDRRELRLDEFAPPAIVTTAPAAPRKFRERTFVVGAFTVTVRGEDDAYENEFWPKQDGDELVLLFHEAAIDARAARQGRTDSLQPPTPFVQTSVPTVDPRARYSADRIEQSLRDSGPREPDPQDDALAGVGLDMRTFAGGLNPGLVSDDGV